MLHGELKKTVIRSLIFRFRLKNLRKGDTRIHYIAFYTIYYIENLAFAVIYAIHSSETNLIFKYSLVIFVCIGFWLAIIFQFVYYRFLHPSDHVRLNTKRNVSSLVHIRPLSHSDHLKRSKSCEEFHRKVDVIRIEETSSEIFDKTSLNFDSSAEERWHNRFAKENRQKILLQQKTIDQRVKLTRVQKQLVNFVFSLKTFSFLFFFLRKTRRNVENLVKFPMRRNGPQRSSRQINLFQNVTK